MTIPRDEEIREAAEDFKNYVSGTGKVMLDLAQTYLSAKGVEEKHNHWCIKIRYHLDCNCEYYFFNEALRLSKLVFIKQCQECKEGKK